MHNSSSKVTEEEKESQIFNLQSFSDIQESMQVLREAELLERAEVKIALLKYAIICFCRPFTNNRGVLEKRLSQPAEDFFSAEQMIAFEKNQKNSRPINSAL